MKAMNFPLRMGLSLALGVALQACAPANTQLGNNDPLPPPPPAAPAPPPPPAPAPPPERCDITGPEAEKPFQPRVRMVFVIDNSMSMEPHQQQLVRNVSLITDELKKNAALDFEIAITNVWDQRTITRGLTPDYGRPGEFRFLKDCPTGNCRVVLNTGRTEGYQQAGYTMLNERTISRRTQDWERVLRHSLLLGTLAVDRRGDMGPHAVGGTEFEEIFTPILGSFSQENLAGPNRGFFQADVPTFFVVLTDAWDSSSMSVNQMIQGLEAFAGGPQHLASRVGLIGISIDRRTGGSCRFDETSGSTNKLEELIQALQTKGAPTMDLSLCDSGWGQRLGQVGQMIARAATETRLRFTGCVPDIGSIRVTYGDVQLRQGRDWRYDARDNSIVIQSSAQITPREGVTFRVTSVKQ